MNLLIINDSRILTPLHQCHTEAIDSPRLQENQVTRDSRADLGLNGLGCVECDFALASL